MVVLLYINFYSWLYIHDSKTHPRCLRSLKSDTCQTFCKLPTFLNVFTRRCSRVLRPLQLAEFKNRSNHPVKLLYHMDAAESSVVTKMKARWYSRSRLTTQWPARLRKITIYRSLSLSFCNRITLIDVFWPLGGSRTGFKLNFDKLAKANSCLFTHPADTVQH